MTKCNRCKNCYHTDIQHFDNDDGSDTSCFMPIGDTICGCKKFIPTNTVQEERCIRGSICKGLTGCSECNPQKPTHDKVVQDTGEGWEERFDEKFLKMFSARAESRNSSVPIVEMVQIQEFIAQERIISQKEVLRDLINLYGIQYEEKGLTEIVTMYTKSKGLDK